MLRRGETAADSFALIVRVLCVCVFTSLFWWSVTLARGVSHVSYELIGYVCSIGLYGACKMRKQEKYKKLNRNENGNNTNTVCIRNGTQRMDIERFMVEHVRTRIAFFDHVNDLCVPFVSFVFCNVRKPQCFLWIGEKKQQQRKTRQIYHQWN